MGQLEVSGTSVVEKEHEGIVMGVLENGIPYLSGRSLAELCGIAPSALIQQEQRWRAGRRDNKFAQTLMEMGINNASLPVVIHSKNGSVTSYAYTDDVCVAVLSYYAFHAEIDRRTARRNILTLAKTSLRDMIYEVTGYRLAKENINKSWQVYHDRVVLNTPPTGYFSVFNEIADLILSSIKAGLPVDMSTMPDISVGMLWGKFWESNELETACGSRIKHLHVFPDYFPQSYGKEKRAWVYPNKALGYFRDWFEQVYVPIHYDTYLSGKVKSGAITLEHKTHVMAAVGTQSVLS